jgi:hypothetical protein
MKPRHLYSTHNRRGLRSILLGITASVLLMAAGNDALARSGRTEVPVESVQSRAAGEPVMAVVSLRDQRVTVYDANGWILRAPVSSGTKGRETPAGIFAVIQKEVEHYSNLYDDAFMPHMQRITWSGIALHGGPLPGYAASHGCIRLPYDFAAQLYDLTKVGMRVIVAPADAAPTEIAHQALFVPKPGAAALAAERAAQAEEAGKQASQARLTAVAASREAARATMTLRTAENLKSRAEAQLAAAQAALNSAKTPDKEERAKDAVAKAATKVEESEAKLSAAKAELQPKLDAVAPAREAAASAEAARVAAVQEARELSRAMEPVSVFISRKTQRLYVRRAFAPILDIPISIQDPDRPLGTHVFTAVEQTNGGAGLRWSVVSLNDVSDAKSALDRIVFPQDAFGRIAETAQARSSLIISDEELSSETGKGTDFVVLLSGEPQGGIARRRSHAPSEAWYQGPRLRYRLPFWR